MSRSSTWAGRAVRGRTGGTCTSKCSCQHCPSLTLPNHTAHPPAWHPYTTSSHSPTGAKYLFCWGKINIEDKTVYAKTYEWALLPMGSGSKPRTFIPLALRVMLSWHCREPRSPWYKHAANYTRDANTSKAWLQCQHYQPLWKTATKKPHPNQRVYTHAKSVSSDENNSKTTWINRLSLQINNKEISTNASLVFCKYTHYILIMLLSMHNRYCSSG